MWFSPSVIWSDKPTFILRGGGHDDLRAMAPPKIQKWESAKKINLLQGRSVLVCVGVGVEVVVGGQFVENIPRKEHSVLLRIEKPQMKSHDLVVT